MGTVEQRIYNVDDKTQLIFTDIMHDRRRGNQGTALSIVTDNYAEVRRLGPEFGPALETIIKRLVGKR